MELWSGNTWDDLIANHNEGRDQDWWLDYTDGIIYFEMKRPTRTSNVLRATYDYGESTVPHDIRDACAMLVAIDLLVSGDFHTSTAEGIDYSSRIQMKVNYYQKQVDVILRNRQEMLISHDA